MVPYVRKSFYRHFKDGMKFVEVIDYNEAPSFKPEQYSFDYYHRISTKAYDYAMDMTLKELQQAVEGMFHNLK